ncbi:ubiquitin-specific protease ESD4 [Trifolium repens]|nr:ubiquitin-specific protease ESD4 [Trifolium repens]
MDNNNKYEDVATMRVMEENNNHGHVDFVNEEEQLAGYVEVDFVNEEAQHEQLDGGKEDLSRYVKELTVLVNNAVNEITDLKQWILAQYSTHFQELQTIVAVKKSLAEISALKEFITVHCSACFDELDNIVRGQQSSLYVVKDSLKLIEVAVCTKPTNDNPKPSHDAATEKKDEDSNPVITIEDEKEEEQDPTQSKGKRKACDSDYESELDKDKEVANTDLVFSDGDYEYHADDVNKRICQTINNLNMQIKQAAPKPILPDAWTNIQNLGKSSDFSNPMRFSNSNYRRDSKSRTMEEDFQSLNGISKKLFESPFSTPTTTAKGKKGSSSTKGKKQCLEVHPLVRNEAGVCFLSKRLVKSRGIEAYRADFDTLTLGQMINHKIVTLVCMRANWVQENYNRGSVWYLPPAFADDVFLGKTIEELIDIYCKDWMPSYPRLKYIYVSINTSSDHWFFMVISMQLQTIYHLDSYCGIGDVKPRRATISIILKENMIRVKTAAILVLGLYNDMWTFIEEEAKNFWALIN